MINRPNISGFIRMEWAIAGVVVALLVSFILRFVNFWTRSKQVASAANIVVAIPAILIVLFLVIGLIMRPFIDRRIDLETKKMREEEQNQKSAADDITTQKWNS